MRTDGEDQLTMADVMARLSRAAIEISADEARGVLDDAAWIAPARAAAQRIVHEEMAMFDPPTTQERP